MQTKKKLIDQPFCHGYEATDVPEGLKSMLPGITFLGCERKPGVYVIYLPSKNRIYVGQATNISQEVSSYLTGTRTVQNQDFRNAIATAKDEFKRYAIYMGPEFTDQSLRLRKEKEIIQRVSQFAYNVQSNPEATFQEKRPTQTQISWKFVQGSLKKTYNIDFIGLPESIGPCIYLIIHPITKRFYIGQSSNLIQRKKKS